MSSRLDNIARRKQALIEKAALERLELTTACRRIRSPIDIDGKLFRNRPANQFPSVAHCRRIDVFDRRLRQENIQDRQRCAEIVASGFTDSKPVAQAAAKLLAIVWTEPLESPGLTVHKNIFIAARTRYSVRALSVFLESAVPLIVESCQVIACTTPSSLCSRST